jgi:rhodanese-related sulfurtransferase
MISTRRVVQFSVRPLEEYDFTEIDILVGGFNAWRDKGAAAGEESEQ